MRGVLFVSLVLMSLSASALDDSQSQALPQPLTLSQALSYIDEEHPRVLSSKAELNKAQARLAIAGANSGFDISAQARARWLEPPAATASFGREDHAMILQGKKTLYDFGRTQNNVDAAAANVQANEYLYQHELLLRRYTIMSAFFDVILADIGFSRDNEHMAIGFIRYDRIRERQELGQYSDIDVLEANADYQEIRRRRMQSEAMQRLSRTRLAEILNRPASVPSQVVPPNLDSSVRKIADVEILQKLAMENNLELLSLRQQLAAAKEQMDAVGSEYWPRLSAQVDLGVYSRDLGSNDLWRAGVGLDIPLYQGGRVGAKKAEQLAVSRSIEAGLRAREREVANAVLETWLQLNNLKIQKEESVVKADYRELYLDRARALYEMEVRTDLGDAMVKLTQASLDSAKVDFDQALAWEKLNILTGGHLEESIQ